jgi:hypothetical protein
MTIQAVSGKRKFRVNPDDHLVVQIQEKHGSQWRDYRKTASWHEASKLVFELAMSPEATVPKKRDDETDELPAVNE